MISRLGRTGRGSVRLGQAGHGRAGSGSARLVPAWLGAALRGHEAWVINKKGRRACRICHAAYQREHYGPGKKSAAR